MLPVALLTFVCELSIDAAPSTLSLFPTHGGNIHAFASAAPGGCAFLDVLTPPYDFEYVCVCARTWRQPHGTIIMLTRQRMCLVCLHPPQQWQALQLLHRDEQQQQQQQRQCHAATVGVATGANPNRLSHHGGGIADHRLASMHVYCHRGLR